tara:strand:+ start:3463 stop:4185 length:723 start_codon:yes stop_codon:yes gene_type:complete
MKEAERKKQERTIFFLTIVFMFMIGFSFSTEINKGFNKDYTIEPIRFQEPVKELLAPRTMDLMITPIALALLVILSVLWYKDHKNLTIKKFHLKKHLNLAKLLRNIHEKIENIEGFEILDLKDKLKFHHKRIKTYHYKNIHPKLAAEVHRTRELFIKQYEKEFTDKFIALIMIVTVVGMSIFALINISPTIYKPEIDIIRAPIIKEQLAPQPVFSAWVFLLAIIIIAITTLLKLRKDNLK